jgi:hypothetical protein
MEIRLWWIQLIGLLGGLLCIGALIAVAFHYANLGNPFPGLAIFALGSGLTAGIYGTQRAIGKRATATSRQMRQLLTGQTPSEPTPETSTV